MRSYLQTVLVTGIGNPFLYLFAMGVGLGSLVSSNLGPNAVDGVSYLEFVAPALLCTAAVTVASEEFTYPIMLGFKWNPTFYGMNAAPIVPGQIIDGVVISVTARLLGTSRALLRVHAAVRRRARRRSASWPSSWRCSRASRSARP